MADSDREKGMTLNPKYDDNGLITAIVTDYNDGKLLMVAHMNEEALQETINSKVAHFFSRSRQRLWKKGETSGNFLNVEDIRVDCDQDAVWIIAKPSGPACHTGSKTCFYRRVVDEGLEYL